MIRTLDISSTEGDQALRLRKRFWVDEYGWKPSDGSDLESDKYDGISQHFGFFEAEVLVGYCRFIPNRGTLPLAGVFPGIQGRLDELGLACGEYSRLIVDPAYRGQDLSLDFYRAVFGACSRQYPWWFFEVEGWMVEVFQSLHFAVEILDDPVPYRGVNGHADQLTYPVLLDIAECHVRMSEANPELYAYFTSALSEPAV